MNIVCLQILAPGRFCCCLTFIIWILYCVWVTWLWLCTSHQFAYGFREWYGTFFLQRVHCPKLFAHSLFFSFLHHFHHIWFHCAWLRIMSNPKIPNIRLNWLNGACACVFAYMSRNIKLGTTFVCAKNVEQFPFFVLIPISNRVLEFNKEKIMQKINVELYTVRHLHIHIALAAYMKICSNWLRYRINRFAVCKYVTKFQTIWSIHWKKKWFHTWNCKYFVIFFFLVN